MSVHGDMTPAQREWRETLDRIYREAGIEDASYCWAPDDWHEEGDGLVVVWRHNSTLHPLGQDLEEIKFVAESLAEVAAGGPEDESLEDHWWDHLESLYADAGVLKAAYSWHEGEDALLVVSGSVEALHSLHAPGIRACVKAMALRMQLPPLELRTRRHDVDH